MKHILRNLFIILIIAGIPALLWSQEQIKPGSETDACVACHVNLHPGLVGDWQRSRHASSTLELALAKPKLEQRVSISSVPPGMDKTTSVGCYECHGLNTDRHADSFSHYGYEINVIVSPDDCAACHPTEVKEYKGSKKAEAVGNLRKNPVYTALVNAVIGMKRFSGGRLHTKTASTTAEEETCFACHGTTVEVKGMQTVQSDFGPVDVPRLTGWPNQGVGRINPDGSKGSCTACHPRHRMSIETARKPATCGQCHLEPDVPAYNVYKESKHGNIYESEGYSWNFTPVPWKPGKDFTAPTCAACHNSLLTGPMGNVIAQRSHDFSSRLWVRIFGLIYSHPQPKKGDTSIIRNGDNLPLPVTFTGERAARYLIDAQEQASRQEKMGSVCGSCHSASWISGHFDRFHIALKEADEMVETATLVMTSIWDRGKANNNDLFDEVSEIYWVRQWLIYANSVRYGSAMMGPDYATFKNGYWALSRNLKELMQFLEDD